MCLLFHSHRTVHSTGVREDLEIQELVGKKGGVREQVINSYNFAAVVSSPCSDMYRQVCV